MNVKLDFICIGFAGLLGTREVSEKLKIKICLDREPNQQPLAFQPGALDLSSTLTIDEMCFKLSRYLGIWI